MTSPSLNISDPASVTSQQTVACSPTSTSEPTGNLCLKQTITVATNASISIVTVSKTTQCDFFADSDCVLCHPPKIHAPHFIISVPALDPTTTRALAPTDVKDGSAPLPNAASPGSASLLSLLTRPTIQQTTTAPQMTHATQTQTQHAEDENPPAQDPDLSVSVPAAQHSPALDLPAWSPPTQNQPAQGQGQPTQRITAQNQNAPSQEANLPGSHSSAQKLPDQSSPTRDQSVQGQGQSMQIKSGLNQNLPAQLPSTHVDRSASTSVAWVQAVVVQSQTILQGAPGVLISGATVKYSAGSIYVGNDAAPLSEVPKLPSPQQKAPDATVIGGLYFTPMQQDVPRATGLPAVVVSGQILTNNGPAATINGQLVAYASGSIHVGTFIAAAPTAASQQQQDVSPSDAVIGGLTVFPVQQGPHAATDKPEVIVQGHTLKEDSKAITIDGTLVAYSSGSIHVGTNAAPAPTFASQRNSENPPQVLEGFTFTPLLLPGSQSSAAPIVVGGQTVSTGNDGARIGTNSILPGAAPITVFGTPVPLGSGGLVIGSQTYEMSGWSTKYRTDSTFATIAGQAISIGPTGAVMIGSTELTPGGSPVTIAGTPISLGATALVVGSSTLMLPPESTPIQSVFTVAGSTFTANPTGFSIAGTLASIGGPAVTIGGTPVSLAPSALIIGSSTIPFASPSFQSIFTVAGTTFTANPSAFRIAGTTLSDNGAAITISGTPISLGPSGLVIGTSTIALNGSATPSPTGLGGVILQGLGPVGSSMAPGSTSTSTPTPESFAGSAAPVMRVPHWGLDVWSILAACMLCVTLAL